jgi:hypothetical protein
MPIKKLLSFTKPKRLSWSLFPCSWRALARSPAPLLSAAPAAAGGGRSFVAGALDITVPDESVTPVEAPVEVITPDV